MKLAQLSPEVRQNLLDKIDKKGGKWHWTGSTNGDGYPKMKDEGELRLSTHLVMELHGRTVPDGKVVMHKDNDTKNIAPSNLRIGTQKQNLKMMRDEGRDRPRGVDQEPDVKEKRAEEDDLMSSSRAIGLGSAGVLGNYLGNYALGSHVKKRMNSSASRAKPEDLAVLAKMEKEFTDSGGVTADGFSAGYGRKRDLLTGAEKQTILMPQRVKSAPIFAHELGHADIDRGVLKHTQKPWTRIIHRNGTAQLVSAASGLLSGVTDNPYVQAAGLAVPGLLHAPQLVSEAGASIQGLRRMHHAGATKGQILGGAVADLLPAFGTYGTAAGLDMSAALANQGVMHSVRDAYKTQQDKLLRRKEAAAALSVSENKMISMAASKMGAKPIKVRMGKHASFDSFKDEILQILQK